MYRNLFYKVNRNGGNGVVTEWTWDIDGNPTILETEHKSHLYVECPVETGVKSIYGTNLNRLEFQNSYKRKEWMQRNPSVRIFESLPPIKEYLLEKYETSKDNAEFAKHQLRVHYLDIEVAVQNEFPIPSLAAYPVNVITVYDTKLDEYHVFLTTNKPEEFNAEDSYWKDDGNVPNNVVFHVFDNEKSLLFKYMCWHKENYPDVISGWNTYAFDMPYLIKRCTNLFEEELVFKMFSPVGMVRLIEKEIRGEMKKFNVYMIGGISQIDYMLIYKHKFLHDPLPNYKLETVAQHELKRGKTSSEGMSFRDFYRKNFRLFVKYNITDVSLVVDLDRKKNYINLSRAICQMGLCEYENIYGSSPYILGALILDARANSELLPSKGLEDEEIVNNEEMEGAFVFDTKIGTYRDGIAIFDVNSLYPNTMTTLNISPETKFGKIVSREEDGSIIVKLTTGKSMTIKKEGLPKLREKLIESPNGVFYFKHAIKTGCIPKTIIKAYAKRKACQKEMKELEKADAAGNKLKIAYLDATQYALKIFLNSIFGQLGNRHFVLFDADNFNSTTAGGRHIIKNSIELMSKNLGENAVIAGDTDSMFLDVREYTKGKVLDKAGIKQICKDLDILVEEANDNCSRIAKEDFYSDMTDRLKFGREAFCTVGTFVGKKMYLVRIMDKEGKETDEWKIRGIDLKKGDLPQSIKNILSEIIMGSTNEHWSSSRYVEAISKAWEIFKKLEPKEMCPSKGYNKEKESDGFLSMEKGAGAVPKAVTFYNHIIENLKLTHKYELLTVGSKVNFSYVVPSNPYGIEAIAFDSQWPEEFNDYFEIDKPKMFQKLVLKSLEKYANIHGWPTKNPCEEVVADINDL